MDKDEIIRRLKKISRHAVHFAGEQPLMLSLDDGIALDDAVRLLKEQEAKNRFLEHQREKGRWIFGNANGHSWMKCSQCCVSQDGQTACYSFCPNCGADMSEGR